MMLKIFDGAGEWSTKMNFVDDTNVVVGYDTSQSCCENCTHGFTQADPADIASTDDGAIVEELPAGVAEKLSFDPQFFERADFNNLDAGGAVVFKLVGDDKPWYLVISNSHNGYYAHGFDMSVGGVLKQSGSI